MSPTNPIEFVKQARQGLSEDQLMDLIVEHTHDGHCDVCEFITEFHWIDDTEDEAIEELGDVQAWSVFEFLARSNPQSFSSNALTESLRVLEMGIDLDTSSAHAAWEMGLHPLANTEQLCRAGDHFSIWIDLMTTERIKISDEEILETLFRVVGHPNASRAVLLRWVESIHEGEWSGHEEYTDEGFEDCEKCQLYLSPPTN